MNDHEPPVDDNDAALAARLAELRQEHQDLDAAILALEALPIVDQLQIARLKRKKLFMRDEIVKLAGVLRPDIIA